MTGKRSSRLAILRRRRDYLAGLAAPNSYDVAEQAALSWALDHIEALEAHNTALERDWQRLHDQHAELAAGLDMDADGQAARAALLRRENQDLGDQVEALEATVERVWGVERMLAGYAETAIRVTDREVYGIASLGIRAALDGDA